MKKINFKIILSLLTIVFVLFSSVGCKTPQLLEFDTVSLQSQTIEYDGQDHSLSVTGVPEGASVSYEGEKNYKNAGEYDITVKIEKNGYNTKKLTAKLTITKATLTVKSKPISVLNGRVGVPEYTIEGFKANDTITDIDVLPTFSGNLPNSVGVHNGAIEFSGASDNNYNFIYQNSDYTVNAYEVFTENSTEYVYFGLYPQTKVSDDTIVAGLTCGIATGDIIADENGWYNYNGIKYAMMVSRPYTYGDNYDKYMDGTTISNGEVCFFKVEPIKWKVISVKGNQRTLTTDLLLDVKQFHDSIENRNIDGKTIYSNNYEHSDIRSWLNQEFLQTAFGSNAEDFIVTTEVKNGADVSRDSDRYTACANTTDKVFMLSYSDVVSGCFDLKDTASDTRVAIVSDYARAKGAFMPVGEGGYYWLRCGSDSIRTVEVVNYEGDVSYLYYNVQNESCCVRPVIVFEINS